ncbi:FAD-dependent oxidoreductase [Candidatus Sumerlaeota bacterium]|nr:FAD-dependent oxidoreductase [Candidatus Sumerlaeota bacterium]
MKTYIVIGGVAGGATAAARLRRLDERARIILFERGAHISYASCGLPYYIGGAIKDREDLFVQTPESFSKRFGIDVRTRTEVLKIIPSTKRIMARNLATGEEYEEGYSQLVLSPGADPVKPPIQGIEQDGVFTLRNVDDADGIMKYIEEKKPQRAVIVGAGFIGLEMAENLHQRGIMVTIVEMAEQVMTMLDFEMAAMAHQHLKLKNVEFYLKDKVISFSRENNRIIVNLESKRNISCDMVLLSIGVRPECKLAKEADLQIGPTCGIVVNEFLQTSNPDIYAVGDAIEFSNPIINKRMHTYLAGPANKQGRIAADNIVLGNKRRYHGSIATAIARVFDLTVAFTGISEKVLKSENIPYISTITHSPCHAGYYPGAMPVTLKIIFSPKEGRLLGAQVLGYQGADKRIDILSTLIQKRGTIYDLMEMEQAYAPPYSSAKDPVNIAGFVAENILNGLIRIVQWYDLCETENGENYLLDVRTRDEYESGTIQGAVNIPLNDLRERMGEIPTDRKIVIFCAAGLRGYLAARILSQNGFENVCNLSGGYITYQLATLKQGNEDIFEKEYIAKDDIIYEKRE